MLTKADKKWLEKRKKFAQREFNSYYFCAYCEKFAPNRLCHSALCPIDVAHVVPRDAAEFEARVAAKLATAFCLNYCDNLNADDCAISDCALYTKRSACRLKHARLAVEAEMG